MRSNQRTFNLLTDLKLRDIWTAELLTKGPQTMDVLSWISRATLDIIGLAGNYIFEISHFIRTPVLF